MTQTPGTRGRDGRDVLHGLEGVTPGPWAKIDGNGYGLPQVAIAPDGKSVAGTTFHRKGREAEANARAIARVPDLIAEVKALREIAAHMLRRIERDIPEHARIDHACEQCMPEGESISDDFVCAIHRARSLLPTPSGEDG